MASRKLTAKQMEALRTLDGHGRTMSSLNHLRLILPDWDRGGWKLGIRGELVLAGWSLEGAIDATTPTREAQ